MLERLPLGPSGRHAYFVHSYHLKPTNEADVLARADYGGPVTAGATATGYAASVICNLDDESSFRLAHLEAQVAVRRLASLHPFRRRIDAMIDGVANCVRQGTPDWRPGLGAQPHAVSGGRDAHLFPESAREVARLVAQAL